MNKNLRTVHYVQTKDEIEAFEKAYNDFIIKSNLAEIFEEIEKIAIFLGENPTSQEVKYCSRQLLNLIRRKSI